MRWILIVGGGIAGLVAVALLIGLLLPREHRASRYALIHQSPDSVWNAVRDLAGVPAWWSEMQQVERLRDSSGREVWRQRMSGFPVTLEIVEEQPARRLVTRILAPDDAPFGGRWVYELAADTGGTRLTITEEGWIANPLFRLVGTVTGLDSTIKQYLRALGRRFGEEVEPA